MTAASASLSESAQLKIVQLIAQELGVRPPQVAAAVALLDEGATVPFIARYRKEATGNLDDTQLRTLEERLLLPARAGGAARRDPRVDRGAGQADRRAARARSRRRRPSRRWRTCTCPYKPKRRTKAQIAREAGLEPLADALLADPTLDPQQEAAKYINVKPAADGVEAINVPDAKAALDGARDILAERFAETAELLAKLRDAHVGPGHRRRRRWSPGKEDGRGREVPRLLRLFARPSRTIPSHRALALFRGRTLGVLTLKLGLGEELEALAPHPCEAMIAAHFGIEDRGRPADKWLADVCRWTWRVKASARTSPASC